MVIYDLICDQQHQFEGWFKNGDELLEQQQSGLLTCPVCDSASVTKKLAAPKLVRKSNSLSKLVEKSANKQPKITGKETQGEYLAAKDSPEKFAQLQQMLGKVHQYVDENFTDVGNRFADEAISIHRGEKDAENIRGTVTAQKAKELAEEGVAVLPLPPKPIEKDKLN